MKIKLTRDVKLYLWSWDMMDTKIVPHNDLFVLNGTISFCPTQQPVLFVTSLIRIVSCRITNKKCLFRPFDCDFSNHTHNHTLTRLHNHTQSLTITHNSILRGEVECCSMFSKKRNKYRSVGEYWVTQRCLVRNGARVTNEESGCWKSCIHSFVCQFSTSEWCQIFIISKKQK